MPNTLDSLAQQWLEEAKILDSRGADSVELPPGRGRLLTPGQVAEVIGGVSTAWVRRNVPHKIRLGHSTVRWYEADVHEWLGSRREN